MQVGPSADPIVCWACLLQPSAGPGPPAPAVANTDDAMAVEMDRQTSENRDSSDDNSEGADFSLSLHKKEMLERKI
jgi:hypothetical protein